MSVTFDRVSTTAKASGVYIEQKAVPAGYGNMVLPHAIAVLGQYNSGKTPTDNTPRLMTTKDEAKQLYGTGSMLAIAIDAVFRKKGSVPVYAIPLADGAGDPTEWAVVVSGPATSAGRISLFIGGIKVTIAVASGDSANTVAAAINTAINANVDLPVTSTVNLATVTAVCKWAGATGDTIRFQQDLDDGDAAAEPAGIGIVATPTVSTAANPVLTTALGNLGAVNFTEIVNPYTDATSLAAIDTAGDNRDDPGVKKPFLAFMGSILSAVNFISAVNARDKAWESWVPVEDSPNMPFEIAAAMAGLWAGYQAAKPGLACRYQTIPGIRAGATAQWTQATNELVVAAGGSTTRPKADGTVQTIDIVTTYKTNALGAADDSYKWASSVANMQFKVYSLDQLYSSPPFDDALVLDDNTPSGAPYAIRPRTVKAYTIKMIDELWVYYGLTKDRDTVVAGIVAEINATNNARIDVLIPDVFALALRIMAGKIEWSPTSPSVAA